MSIETRGREAAEDLRSEASRVDVESGLSHLRRTRRRRNTGRVVAASVVLACVVGIPFAVAGDDRTASVEPASTPNPSIIDSGDGTGLPHGEEPPDNARPGWNAFDHDGWFAFDQESGLFLYVSLRGRVNVGDGATGTVALFDCPVVDLCERGAFGPALDELTVPSDGPDGPQETLRVLGLDGTVRRTLDLAGVVTDNGAGHGQAFADLAWSPDGSRLAVATEPGDTCDPRIESCDGLVWLFDRDGGDPELVHTEPASDHLVDGEDPDLPNLVDLAWSPDGRTLGLVVGTTFYDDAADRGVWPRLLALRFEPGQPVRTDLLHTYDDRWDEYVYAWEYDTHFAFAWSPDGSRIAVTHEGGVAEISAEDGEVLVEHPGEGVHGPLAWLRGPGQ